MSEVPSEIPIEVREQITAFERAYARAKKSVPNVTKLGQLVIIPIEDETNLNKEIECREGCTYCCNLRVVAYPFEIIAIYLYLNEKLDRAALAEVKEKVGKQYELIHNMTTEQHFQTNVECPLLSLGQCRVYPVRPVACAGYHSGSVAACKDSHERPEVVGIEEGGIPMFYGVKEAQELQNSIVAFVADQAGDDSNQYELISGLWQLFNSPGLIRKWRAGKQTFKNPE